jgi:hypothetical protein
MIPNDLYPAFETLNQRQLGHLFGVSSHQVGRWLKEIGLRRYDGEPAQKAIDEGIAAPVNLDDGTHPFWAWAKEATVRILEAAGHARVSAATTPLAPLPQLLGPFTAKRSDAEGDGFEVADSNGLVAIWCRGEELAGRVVKLLNLAHEAKKWFS